MTESDLNKIKQIAYKDLGAFHGLRKGQSFYNAARTFIKDNYGIEELEYWRTHMPEDADCFYLDANIEKFWDYCSNYHIGTQK